ncbi:MAG: MBL fold metallo-hydrolase [Labrys sp. (in: a-proteobacteria)]
MSLVATILGCGSSGGVPRVGAGWGACDPKNPRNRRRRCSLLVERVAEAGRTTVLVDTGPDVREQLLDAEVAWIDAVLFTHEHADHTHGIDDMRVLAIHQRRLIEAHADDKTADLLIRRFGYCFETPPGSQYPPILALKRLDDGIPIHLSGRGGGLTAVPFMMHHGDTNALGFRFGNLAYSSDVNGLPPESEALLQDLDVWIVDALRYTQHPSHWSLADALAWIERIKPRRAILTNLHTDMDYDTLCRSLPAHVVPAYDGMRIAFED